MVKLKKKVEGNEKVRSLPPTVSMIPLGTVDDVNKSSHDFAVNTFTHLSSRLQTRHTRNSIKRESKVGMAGRPSRCAVKCKGISMLQCADGTLQLLNKPFLYIHC